MDTIGLKILIVTASLGVGGVAGAIVEAIGDPSAAVSGAIVGGVVAIVGLVMASFAPPTPSRPL